MKKNKFPTAEWNVIAFQQAAFERPDGQTLMVQVICMNTTKYGVVAIESATDASIRKVLEHHAHKIVGKFPTESEARRGAETFAKQWWQSGKSADECKCTEIEPAAKPTVTHKPSGAIVYRKQTMRERLRKRERVSS